jgi:hypothetical protein
MDRLACWRTLILVAAVWVGLMSIGGSPDVATVDTDWRATGFDAPRIAQLTRMARLAYDPAPPARLGRYALVVRHEVNFTLSVDVWDAGDDVVVAFSGTDPDCARSVAKSLALVWKSPVEIRASSGRPAPAVQMCTHKYVLTGLRLLLNRYRAVEGRELADWLAERISAGARLTTTGHSRGGVAAMLMAHYELLSLEDPPSVLAISAPPTFCSRTAARLPPGRTARTLSVAAADDPVAGLQHGRGCAPTPGCADDYRHVGTVAQYRSDGLVAVEHRRSTSLASRLALGPHAIDTVDREAQLVAERCPA